MEWMNCASVRPACTRPKTHDAIVATNVHKSFTTSAVRVDVLRDISLTVRAGEMTLISGPSGCGKSTLLSIISGLQPADRGTVQAAGTDLAALTTAGLYQFRLKHTGFIFQGFNLFSALTAFEQVALPLIYMGMPRRQASQAAMQALRDVDMARYTTARPFQLSGGQKQRVAIARALAKRPSLMFADEPTSALDAENGQRVTELLSRIARERGATVVCVSHDPRMMRHADRVITMEDGEIRNDTSLLSRKDQHDHAA